MLADEAFDGDVEVLEDLALDHLFETAEVQVRIHGRIVTVADLRLEPADVLDKLLLQSLRPESVLRCLVEHLYPVVEVVATDVQPCRLGALV